MLLLTTLCRKRGIATGGSLGATGWLLLTLVMLPCADDGSTFWFAKADIEKWLIEEGPSTNKPATAEKKEQPLPKKAIVGAPGSMKGNGTGGQHKRKVQDADREGPAPKKGADLHSATCFASTPTAR